MSLEIDTGKTKILFIRTFKQLMGGGTVPPVGLLYLASAIRQAFGEKYEIKVVDTGIGFESPDETEDLISKFSPDIVGLSSLSCEANLMDDIALQVKNYNKQIVVIAGGSHTSVAGENILDNENIDFAVIGEGERTIIELLEAFENKSSFEKIDGIVFRRNGEIVVTKPRKFIEDLDDLPIPAWDLLDFKAYGRIPNWNGTYKEPFYLPLVTSRGCPYKCVFCHNMFGKQVRLRSAENVVAEIKLLYQTYGVKEFHIIDDIFNIKPKRAKQILTEITKIDVKFSFSFPNGLRADLMTPELVKLFAKAGTYRIHYGFETIVERLQLVIGKNVKIKKAIETINQTASTKIITGAYFMFGLPTETREDILQTIKFAVSSKLDVAYFFKATSYPGTEFYQSELLRTGEKFLENYEDYHFFSVNRSHTDIPVKELNSLILLAQQKFFLRPIRLWRAFFKWPQKLDFIRNLFGVFGQLLQNYIMQKLLSKSVPKNKEAK